MPKADEEFCNGCNKCNGRNRRNTVTSVTSVTLLPTSIGYTLPTWFSPLLRGGEMSAFADSGEGSLPPLGISPIGKESPPFSSLAINFLLKIYSGPCRRDT